MTYQEKDIGEGVYAADENNARSSQRGSFVRSGGAVTVGASSTDVVVNIDATDIRLDGADFSLSSGSIALADNSTAYPRRDLVVARSGGFDFMTGDPIAQDTFDTLVSEGVIDADGLPIHKPADIPEIQPPAFTGERTTATLLAMVYVPPGTTDSTGLAGEYITDMRMEGIGVGDVLRSGDAVAEVEEANRELDLHSENASRYAERTYGDFAQELPGHLVSAVLDPGTEHYEVFFIPDTHRLQVWSLGVVAGDTDTGTAEAFIQIQEDDGSWAYRASTTENYVNGNPITNVPGGALFRYRLRNDGNTKRTIYGRFGITIDLRAGYGYTDE